MGEPAFLCPACHSPLPAASAALGEGAVVACLACAAEVDLARAGTAAGRPRFVPEADRTGETVGGYLLVGRLGAGGMGTIYSAKRAAPPKIAQESAQESSEVAVKMMGAGLAHDPPAVSRFLREIAVLRDLHHPHIVRVLDAGMHQGVPWFAMELVDGEDLRKRLARGPLEPGEARPLVRDLFSALAAAHARGIVHRDLKPANVLLSPSGTKLADFGVAASDDARRDLQTQLTESAAVLGTLPYMSPEQRAGRRVDGRSDLFSAGVLLYEAITGQLPMGAFPAASLLNPTFPSSIDPVIMALLQPDPALRPADARDASARWEKAMTPRPSRLRPVAATLVGLLTLCTTGLVLRPAERKGLLSQMPIAATARRSFTGSRGPLLPPPPAFARTPRSPPAPGPAPSSPVPSLFDIEKQNGAAKRKAALPPKAAPRPRNSKLASMKNPFGDEPSSPELPPRK